MRRGETLPEILDLVAVVVEHAVLASVLTSRAMPASEATSPAMSRGVSKLL
jgi:hypothetical protein